MMISQRTVLLFVLLIATLLLYGLNWQGQVIEEQTELIRTLRQDSSQLLQQRMQEVQRRRVEHQMQQFTSQPSPGAGVGCLPHQVCG